jgi:hypothetical protein
MVEFKGSTQEEWPSEIFRFGYGKALNDKKVPDPVGSEVFVLQKLVVRPTDGTTNMFVGTLTTSEFLRLEVARSHLARFAFL